MRTGVVVKLYLNTGSTINHIDSDVDGIAGQLRPVSAGAAGSAYHWSRGTILGSGVSDL